MNEGPAALTPAPAKLLPAVKTETPTAAEGLLLGGEEAAALSSLKSTVSLRWLLCSEDKKASCWSGGAFRRQERLGKHRDTPSQTVLPYGGPSEEHVN